MRVEPNSTKPDFSRIMARPIWRNLESPYSSARLNMDCFMIHSSRGWVTIVPISDMMKP